jgi:hypothetical protein
VIAQIANMVVAGPTRRVIGVPASPLIERDGPSFGGQRCGNRLVTQGIGRSHRPAPSILKIKYLAKKT